MNPEDMRSVVRQTIHAALTMPPRGASIGDWHMWLVHPTGECPDGCDAHADPVRLYVYEYERAAADHGLEFVRRTLEGLESTTALRDKEVR